jgi:hypothetical protein
MILRVIAALLLFCLILGADPERTSKDPSSVEDFAIDWSLRATGGNDIASSTWTVPTGITKISDGATATRTLIRLSGGTVGKTYRLRNLVTLEDSQVLAKTIDIYVDYQ